jgi:hypothetical protein
MLAIPSGEIELPSELSGAAQEFVDRHPEVAAYVVLAALEAAAISSVNDSSTGQS